ncbi:transposase family protein [Streptomyces sp. NPDC002054]|uniref:transposase family protein n=1 Tax=Streptomyces sp. NPDC002054 TaxID=3154663 RepID=UPI00331C5412
MSLTERLVRLPDPHRRRGVCHPFVSVVLIAASAVVAGARSYTAIGQWPLRPRRPPWPGWVPGRRLRGAYRAQCTG